MKALTKLKDQARTHEQREEWEKAINIYLEVLHVGEEGEGEADLPLYNRIGDLFVRLGRPEEAVKYYEQAADRYAEAGLYNNAIALCNKALRYVPKRWSIYRKLGQFSASQGFLTDARRWFLEYAEQMFKAGNVDDALGALQDFANIADDAEIRELLGRQFNAHGRSDEAVQELKRAYTMRMRAGQTAEAMGLADEIRAIDPKADVDEAATAQAPQSYETHGHGEVALPGFSDLGLETAAGAAFGADAGIGLDSGNISLDEGPLEVGSAPLDFDPGNISLEEDGAVHMEEAEPLPLIDLDHEEEVEPLPTFDLEDQHEDEEAAPLPLIDLGIEIEVEGEADEGTFSFDLPTLGETVPDEEMATSLPTFDLGVAGEEGEAEPEPELPLPAVKTTPDLETTLARIREMAAAGSRGAAMNELQQLHTTYAGEGEYRNALSSIGEQLRLDPENVRLLQQRVEYAVRLGEQTPLLSAYIDLAYQLNKMGATTKARAVYSRVLDLDPTNMIARDALEEKKSPEKKRGGDYVDLNSFLQEDEDDDANTRFVVAEKAPTGDEERDFADLLSQFKAKVAENVGSDDPSSHYDLGLAFKEMGLIDEAISEFQIALRGGQEKLQVYEELGQCFMLKEQYNVAVKVLSRALQLPHDDEAELLGVYYHLGRCFEELGNRGEARDAYERVVGLDIQFRDVTDRLARL